MQRIHQRFKQTVSTRKGRIGVLIIALVIAALGTGGFLYWKYNKKALIREKLTSTIEEKTAGLYQLKYDDLQLDEVAGNVSVTNLQLNYDSSIYLTQRDASSAPPVLLNIRIPSILITGVKTPRALLSKEIVGKKLQINSPVIEISYTYTGKDSARNTPTKEVYEQILGDLKMIKIDTLEIKNATITTRSLKTGMTKVQLDDTNVQLIDVAVDSTADADKSRLLFSKEMNLQVSKVSWSSPNKLYDCFLDSLNVKSAVRELTVRGFHLDPTLGENAFVKSLPAQDDRFDFRFNNIRLSNIDFHSLLNEELIADEMQIQNASLKIYRDLSIPRDKKSRVGRYPHQLFSKLPLLVRIGKLTVPNCFIEYKEKNPRSQQAGKVQFYNTNAVFSNVSNDKDRKDNIMTASVSSRFLNKASLQTNWKFYMSNPNGRFDVTGKLGSIAAKDINIITEPMGPARLEKGTINSFEFKLSGGDHTMNGDVLFLYEDLKVSLLEKDKGEKELDKKGLTSILANFIIKDSNPSGKKDEPRRIDVSMARDPNRSIFYFIWKTLFKGIQETVGINKKK